MKRIISVLVVVLVISCLLGCDTYEMFNRYPGDKSLTWYCEAIDFEIRFAADEHGNWNPKMSLLEWDDISYTVYLGFHVGYFIMYSYKVEGPYEEDDLLLYGEWHYEGDNLVFKITEDNVFGNTFKELVFVPMD